MVSNVSKGLKFLKHYLCASVLTTDRQTHGVSPSSVCSHVSQTLDVVLQFPPQVVLDSELLKFCGEVVDLTVTEHIQSSGLVDMKTSHEALGDLRTDTVETLEGVLDQTGFRKVDSEDELRPLSGSMKYLAERSDTHDHDDGGDVG